jgi:pantoate kinase
MLAEVDAITGLGDVVAAATKAIGIKPCGGCQQRREALNKLLPFVDNPTPDL